MLPDGRDGVRATLAIMDRLVNAAQADPAVLDLVSAIASRYLTRETDTNARTRDLALCSGISREVTRRVRYVKDPKGLERVSWAPATLARGFGDCDDIAVVIATLARAAGLGYRFVAHGPGTVPSHVYTAVMCSDGREVAIDPVRESGVGYVPKGDTIMTYDGRDPGIGDLGAGASKKYARDAAAKSTAKLRRDVKREFVKLRAEWKKERSSIASKLRMLQKKDAALEKSIARFQASNASLAQRLSTSLAQLRGTASQLATRLTEAIRREEAIDIALNEKLTDLQKRAAILERGMATAAEGRTDDAFRYIQQSMALLAQARGDQPAQTQAQQSAGQNEDQASGGYYNPYEQGPSDANEALEF